MGQILVNEKWRGNKIGLKLMIAVTKDAVNDCLITWTKRNWNTYAHKFYDSIGANQCCA